MSASFIYAVIFLALFASSYMMKRRFGLLGLALAAGALLSELWAGSVSAFLDSLGVDVVAASFTMLAIIFLTILPAVVVLFIGPTYSSKLQKLVGSLLFAALAIALIAPQIGTELVYDPIGLAVNNMIESYRPFVVGGGLVLAVIDIMLTSMPKHHKLRSKKGE